MLTWSIISFSVRDVAPYCLELRVVEARFGDIVRRRLKHKSWMEGPLRSRNSHQLRNDSVSFVAPSTT
jgi:hypothetical protein